jgi:Fur family zinc uptake transcriptional regulator
MTKTMQRRRRASPLRDDVLQTLIERGLSSAYEIADHMRETGKRSCYSGSVYRALDHLAGEGKVDFVASLRGYIALPEKPGAGLLVCTSCKRVDVVDSERLEADLSGVATDHKFETGSIHCELVGTCSRCAGEARDKSDRSS